MKDVSGVWHLVLIDDTDISFYYDYVTTISPLKRIKEFNQGDCWAIDASSDSKLIERFKIWDEDDSFILIPKIEVKKVYFECLTNL